ncbi:YfcZ/YiiS family protein [Endozoicomonas sp. Mp262]|uniref:YfcZ/YiiS family protein n=1 Tax=Endozoicomonas sp. Mp262 TaxID=2919499 RepID=UPI0021E07B1A
MKDSDEFESMACNCVDVGTLINEDDTRLVLDFTGDNACEEFSRLETKAKSIGSGNCKVSSETLDDKGMTHIRAMFDFDCTAEKLIFQMNQR